MIKVLFFARVRELTGVSTLYVESKYDNVAALRTAFAKRNENWAVALESGKVLAAVNQKLVPMSHQLQTGDEVAFFPPVTGG